jgi:dTDP-4-dehydrorhamnose reductase
VNLNHEKIIILGCAGRLGSALVKDYSLKDSVIGLGRKNINLTDLNSIRKALKPLTYTKLILTGALTSVDYCENNQKEAFLINALAPKLIAEISAEKDAHVTFISTDYVFDGYSKQPYTETDSEKPLSVYGASKLEGEKNILKVSESNLVARVSWLYGSNKPAFPEWIIKEAVEKSQLALPSNKIGCPTYVEDVVNFLRLLLGLDSKRKPAEGIFHLANSGQCNWRDWGQYCIDQAKLAGIPIKCDMISSNKLEDIDSFVAKRPVNSVLDISKFIEFTNFIPRQWNEVLKWHLSGISK